MQPYFTLVMQNKFIIAGKQTLVKVKLNDGVSFTKQPELTTKYSVSPQIDIEKIRFNRADSTLLVEEGALEPGLTYKVTFTVTNNKQGDSTCEECAMTREIKFKTELGPHYGIISIKPVKGFANRTKYRICLNNWRSERYPLKVQLTGIGKWIANKVPVGSVVLREKQSDNNCYVTKLPLLSSIHAVITDTLGLKATA